MRRVGGTRAASAPTWLVEAGSAYLGARACFRRRPAERQLAFDKLRARNWRRDISARHPRQTRQLVEPTSNLSELEGCPMLFCRRRFPAQPSSSLPLVARSSCATPPKLMITFASPWLAPGRLTCAPPSEAANELSRFRRSTRRKVFLVARDWRHRLPPPQPLTISGARARSIPASSLIAARSAGLRGCSGAWRRQHERRTYTRGWKSRSFHYLIMVVIRTQRSKSRPR